MAKCISTSIPIIFFAFFTVSQASAECVILLHGLARTHKSMAKMEFKLDEAGYQVVNHSYPSREGSIASWQSPQLAVLLPSVREIRPFLLLLTPWEGFC